jgi:hypothetical protein
MPRRLQKKFERAKARGQGDQFLANHPKFATRRSVAEGQYSEDTIERPTRIRGAGRQANKLLRADQQAQDLMMGKQIQASNPNINTALGGQTVTRDEEGNVTLNQNLSDNQQQILNQGEALTQLGQQLAQQQLGGFTPFGGGGGQQPGGQIQVGGTRTNPEYSIQGGPAGGGSPQTYNPSSLAQGLMGDRQRIENSVFQGLTRDLERNRGRDMEAAQQSLYNRGITYSNDPNSRYQQELGDLNRRYDDMNQNARLQATQFGGQELANQFGMGLQSHQQQLSDIANLQNMGSGLMMPNLPGYAAPTPYNITNPAELNLALEKLKQSGQLTSAQANLYNSQSNKLNTPEPAPAAPQTSAFNTG